MKRTRTNALVGVAAGIVLVAPSTRAQEASGATLSIETLIVTATKREESIQTVGLSVSALSGVDLQAIGAVDFEDYAITVPGLAFGATDDGILGNRTISIRGVEGLNTTGFYLDEVPIDESIDPAVLDVERVEVLRGPQGTLYGARGLGGTLRVITKQPDLDERTGRGRAGISFTEEGGLNYITDGSLNIPLSDTVAVRGTAYFIEEEGVFDRVVGPMVSPGVSGANGLVGDAPTTEENVDDRTTYGVNLALLWAPAPYFDVTTRVLAQRTELDGFPLADDTFDPAATPSSIVLSADDFTQERLFNNPEEAEDQWLQVSVTANYDFGFGTLTSSTGYFERNVNEQEDSSEFISFTLLGGILPGAGLSTEATAISSPIFQELDFRTIVQETRFVSDFDGPFQITSGFFYQLTQDDEAFNPANFGEGFDEAFSTQVSGGAATSGLSGVGDLIFESNLGFEVEELGAYADGSYDLTDRLSVGLGARFFDTETTFFENQSGFAVGGLDAVNVGPVTQAEDGFNFKGLIEFEATDEVYFYGSIAEGFRIGGSNAELPAALGCDAQVAQLGISVEDARTFDSDELLSYEAGAKTQWMDGRFTANGSLFYIDIDGIQQRVLLECGFQFTANIGSARSQGFEVETTWYATDDLTLEFAAGYTDAEFTETVSGIDADGDPVVLVEEGDSLQQIPEWNLAASLDYTFPVSVDYDGFLRTDYAYVGESISRVVDSSNPRLRPSYDIVNARVGMRADRLELSLFVNNLLNEDAVFADNRTLAAEALGRPRVVRNRPRTIGVDLRANF